MHAAVVKHTHPLLIAAGVPRPGPGQGRILFVQRGSQVQMRGIAPRGHGQTPARIPLGMNTWPSNTSSFRRVSNAVVWDGVARDCVLRGGMKHRLGYPPELCTRPEDVPLPVQTVGPSCVGVSKGTDILDRHTRARGPNGCHPLEGGRGRVLDRERGRWLDPLHSISWPELRIAPAAPGHGWGRVPATRSSWFRTTG